MNKNCLQCNIVFLKPYQSSIGQWEKRKFCSKKCAAFNLNPWTRSNNPITIKPKIHKICLTCKKKFSVFLCRKTAKFCSSGCWGKSIIGHPGYFNGKSRLDISGKKHWNWKGGKIKNSSGYTLVHQPNHPRKDRYGYIREHHLVTEKYLKRFLNKKEIVHHINHKRSDNRPENLYVFSSQLEHRRFHAKEFLLSSNII